MSLLRQLRHGLRSLMDREGADRDIADEVEHYLEEEVAALMAAGVPPDQARRRVRLEIGHPAHVREEVRSYGWENVVERVVEDVRYGARRLRRSPGFAMLGVLTLALGIGATTTIFSAARPVLFEPLPYPESHRILSIADRAPDGAPIDVTFGTYRELTERSRSLEALAVVRTWQPTLTGAAEPERLTGGRVTAGYFSNVLGVSPALGRTFEASEDRRGGATVVILADALWRSRFGADSAILGRQVVLDDQPHTVIGVMGPEHEDVLSPSSRLWAPLQYDAALPSFDGREWGHHLRMVARVRPGVSLDQAAQELDRIARAPMTELPRPPWSSLEHGLAVTPLKEAVTGGSSPTLLALLAAVVLLLLIACMNVSHLLLGRAVQRRGELAMRRALGAPSARLIQQLLTEGLTLALLGGVVGIALSAVGVRALVALAPPDLPRLDAIRMDAAVLAVALGITTLVGAAVGLIPALHASRGSPERDLRETSRRTAGGHRIARSALVVAEISLTLVLLVGAGLLLRSLDRLFAIHPGFEPAGVLALQVQTSGSRYSDADVTHRFFSGIVDAVRTVPGVSAGALTSQLPLSGEADVYGVLAEAGARGDAGADDDRGAFRYAVTPGFFETLGVPLLQGRALEASDVAGSPPVVVISESLARRRFPGRDPIGERVHVGRTDLPRYTVVGVVGDVRQVSLSGDGGEAAYVTPGQWYFADRAMWVVVRTRGEPAALAPAVREAIWSVDPDQPIVRVGALDDVVAASAAERRFALRVFQAFGIAALILAAVGLYGVLAGSVSERMREMGVRTALGATRVDLLGLVVREGLTLTALGVLLGVAGAVAMSQALATLLFGVSRLDPITYLGVIALLGAIAALASAVPAWRAARVDPCATLRTE